MSLIKKIETYLKKTGMSETAFGREVLNDPNLIADLKAGRSPSLNTAEKIEAFMADKAK